MLPYVPVLTRLPCNDVVYRMQLSLTQYGTYLDRVAVIRLLLPASPSIMLPGLPPLPHGTSPIHTRARSPASTAFTVQAWRGRHDACKRLQCTPQATNPSRARAMAQVMKLECGAYSAFLLLIRLLIRAWNCVEPRYGVQHTTVDQVQQRITKSS